MRALVPLVPVVVLVVAMLALLAPAPLAAQGADTLAGQVTNGTPGGEQPAGLTVELQVTDRGATLQTLTTTTDQAGRFQFLGVPTGNNVNYVLSARYKGVSYSAVVDKAQGLSNVALKVYETTQDMSGVKVQANRVVVTGADARGRVLSMLEMVTLENTGDRTFVPDLSQPAMMNFLRFPVPAGFRELEVSSTLRDGNILEVDRGFAMTTPIPPGSHEVLFTYLVPYSGTSLDLSRTFALGVQDFFVLIPEGLAEVKAQGLGGSAPVTIGQTTYRVLEAKGLPPGGQVSLTLQGLPQASLPVRLWDGLKSAASLELVVGSVLGLALLGVLAFALVRGRRVEEQFWAGVPASGSRAELAEAIAELDDLFDRKEIEEEEYRRQRAELKARLLALALAEHLRGRGVTT